MTEKKKSRESSKCQSIWESVQSEPENSWAIFKKNPKKRTTNRNEKIK